MIALWMSLGFVAGMVALALFLDWYVKKNPRKAPPGSPEEGE